MGASASHRGHFILTRANHGIIVQLLYMMDSDHAVSSLHDSFLSLKASGYIQHWLPLQQMSIVDPISLIVCSILLDSSRQLDCLGACLVALSPE